MTTTTKSHIILSMLFSFCSLIHANTVIHDNSTDTASIEEFKQYVSYLVQDELSKQAGIKSWELVSQQSKNAVVQIFAHRVVPNLLEPYKTPEESLACGSGFFISDQGHILTNFHVVDTARMIFIQIASLSGKERFSVEYIGGHPEKDVALLKLTDESLQKLLSKLDSHKLTYLEPGNSDILIEGQEIMIMGYPLGEENLKIATGSISGNESFSRYGDCKQTTTPINPGNSGGPFLDRTGKVVGIGVAKVVSMETEGIGYLIPINNVKAIFNELFTTKIIEKPNWGMSFMIPTSEHTLKYLGNPTDGGIYLSRVNKGFLAAAYDLQRGDVLYAIDNHVIDRFGFFKSPWSDSLISFSDYTARLETGATTHLTLYRKGVKIEQDVIIKTYDTFKINDHYPWYQPPLDYEVFGGLVIVPLTLTHVEIFKGAAKRTDPSYLFPLIKYEQDENRLQPRLTIAYVIPESQAYRTNFCGNDRIVKAVNNVPVQTLEDFRNAVLLSKGQEYVTIEAEGGAFCALSLQEIFEKEESLAACFGHPISPLIGQLKA